MKTSRLKTKGFEKKEESVRRNKVTLNDGNYTNRVLV